MRDVLATGTHAESGRRALMADEGDSVWLYLTEPGVETIHADCWLYNRVDAPSAAALKERFASYRARGLPPPAPADLVLPEALRPVHPGASEIRFVWSRDGEGVAAWERGELVGFIAPGQRRGFSRFLIGSGPWGAPLDLDLYEELFPPERS